MDFRQGFISIVTPVYNGADYLDETIQSVLGQSLGDFEWVLVDDASTDQSAQLIQTYDDPRIRLIQLDRNQGAAVARNTGLQAAVGQYIAFIDADDVWHPDKLAKQLAFMEATGYPFTYTNIAYMSEEGNLVKSGVDLPPSLDYAGLLKNTAIACSTVMIDRQQLGHFEMPLLRKGQDTATWLMLMRTRKVSAYGLDQVLNKYRQRQGSISSNKLQALKRTWNTYYRVEQLPLPQAVYYFLCYVANAIKRRF